MYPKDLLILKNYISIHFSKRIIQELTDINYNSLFINNKRLYIHINSNLGSIYIYIPKKYPFDAPKIYIGKLTQIKKKIYILNNYFPQNISELIMSYIFDIQSLKSYLYLKKYNNITRNIKIFDEFSSKWDSFFIINWSCAQTLKKSIEFINFIINKFYFIKIFVL